MCQFSNAVATFLGKIVEKVNAEPTVFINSKGFKPLVKGSNELKPLVKGSKGFKPLVKKRLRQKEYKNFLQDRIEAELTLF